MAGGSPWSPHLSMPFFGRGWRSKSRCTIERPTTSARRTMPTSYRAYRYPQPRTSTPNTEACRYDTKSAKHSERADPHLLLLAELLNMFLHGSPRPIVGTTCMSAYGQYYKHMLIVVYVQLYVSRGTNVRHAKTRGQVERAYYIFIS